jgi:hypothetical protein
VQAGSGGRVDSQAPLIYAGALRSSESRIPPCRPPRGARRVRPGDELHIESEVIRGATVEVTYKPSTDQGRTTTLNQNDEAVQVQIANLIVPDDSLPSPGDTVDCDAADRIIVPHARDERSVHNVRNVSSINPDGDALLRPGCERCRVG